MLSRRVASLSRGSKLEARWKDRLRQEIKHVLNEVVTAGRRLACRPTTMIFRLHAASGSRRASRG